MKIQLQSLRVVNCGPLDDVCIQFNTNGDSPVTVLAGANGSGKTTILELCVALFTLIDQHSDTIQQSTQSTIDSLFAGKTGYAQINILCDNKPLSVGYSSNLTQVPDDVDLKVSRSGAGYQRVWMSDDDSIPHLLFAVAGETDVNNPKTVTFLAMQAEHPNTIPSILFFPHTRSLGSLQGTQIQREETEYKWVYIYEDVRSFAGSLESYLIWLDYADPDTYTQVITFLNSLNFDGKKFSVQRKELRAIVTTREGQTHNLAKLSSGEQNILIMLLELRRRLLPYSIVLIDEIENSLHPAFQHRLAQGLKQLQAMIPYQLIVTTHSSEFARIFGSESVRILTEF